MIASPSKDGKDGPLPSLAAARNAIRIYRQRHSNATFDVEVRGGTYFLCEPLKLDPEDSGAPQAPVIYEAYPGEHPVISGGEVVSGWRRDGPKLCEADWAKATTQLFVNGSRGIRSRWPDQGYLRILGPSSREKEFMLHYKADDLKPEWANSGAEVVVLLAWAEMRRTIISFDQKDHIAVLAGLHVFLRTKTTLAIASRICRGKN